MVNFRDEKAYDYADIEIIKRVSDPELSKHFETVIDPDTGKMLIELLVEQYTLHQVSYMNVKFANDLLKEHGFEKLTKEGSHNE